jgi:hypothetical protein
MPVIPALRRLRKEDHAFDSLTMLYSITLAKKQKKNQEKVQIQISKQQERVIYAVAIHCWPVQRKWKKNSLDQQSPFLFFGIFVLFALHSTSLKKNKACPQYIYIFINKYIHSHGSLL